MNWNHIQLIYHREMRDQLRDRRTLFSITILPLLLYPLLGMLMMQVAQFKREQSVRIQIIGIENWPKSIPFVSNVDDSSMSASLGDSASDGDPSDLVELQIAYWPKSSEARIEALTKARRSIDAGMYDLIVVVEPEFAESLNHRRAAEQPGENGLALELPEASGDTSPSTNESELGTTAMATSASGLTAVANLARDKSQLALRRFQSKLDGWHQRWVARELSEAGMNPVLVEPIPLNRTDTSESSVRQAMIWSKVLPFVMLVWALTGAFYPAIDLCAGEKERGTLETLLSSPARRREIVWGKLLTVATFSMMSALLNLASMQATAGFVIHQLASQGAGQMAEAFGPLPIHAFAWLVLLLIPMAAFFSALALAVAALARSTKEGQYYLMPLLLFTVPLVTLPMIPSLELNLATSLMPVTGAVFVVRAFIEGRFIEGFMFLPFVVMVTTICCLLSIRWAVRQFESESVMFSENERWNFQAWVKQVWRDRGTVASASESMLCGAIILVAVFFAQFVSTGNDLNWDYLAQRAVVSQLGLILTPCLLMAIMLTRSLRHALRLHSVPVIQLCAAVIFALALHPMYTLLGQAIASTFKIGPETAELLQMVTATINAQPLWAILLVLALVPAMCEELTYRGFIFGGLLRNKGALRAVLVSSLFFGLAHSFLQQSIAATIMGLLLGVIAWRTGSVVCTMIIHVINNGLSLTFAWMCHRDLVTSESMDWMIQIENGEWHYQPLWISFSLWICLLMLAVLWHRSPSAERLVEAELA